MLKKLMCILLVIPAIFSLFSISAFAEEEQVPDGYIYIPPIEEPEAACDNSNERAAQNFVYVGQKRYWGVIRNYDYLCYKDKANNWYAMTGLNLTWAFEHYQGSYDKPVKIEISQKYNSQTASNFSVGVGGGAGVGDMVDASVDLGYGVQKTKGREFEITSSIQFTVKANYPTGYYKLHVCHNFHSMKITQQRIDGSHPITDQMAIPFGESYITLLHSSSTESGTWRKVS